jgi:hypothetical protein
MPKLCFRLPFLHCFNGRLCPSSLPPDERSRGHPQLGPSPADWTPSICAYENGKSNTCNAGKEFVYIVSCFDSCIELGRTCGSNKRTARSRGRAHVGSTPAVSFTELKRRSDLPRMIGKFCLRMDAKIFRSLRYYEIIIFIWLMYRQYFYVPTVFTFHYIYMLCINCFVYIYIYLCREHI